MVFGQVHYRDTCFLTWMMKGKEKMMVTMKRKKDWKILMREIRMKVKKMRRRKMKEMRTNGTWMDSNLFKFPWEQVAVFFFFSSPVLSHPVFKVSFLFIPRFTTSLGIP